MLKIIKNKLVSSKELNKKGVYFYLNPYSYLLLRKKKSLLDEAEYICIDGQWLCHFLKLFGISSVERCSFDNSSAAPIVFKYAENHAQKVVLIGTDKEAAEKFKLYLLDTYPSLNIVLSRDGYFKSQYEISQSHQTILDLQADLVIVGMGAIKQEEYLIALKEKGWSGSGYTCGGFMHQTARKGHKYYPNWVNKFDLRFIYRIWDEPKLLRRYTIDYGRFAIVFIKDYLYFRKNK